MTQIKLGIIFHISCFNYSSLIPYQAPENHHPQFINVVVGSVVVVLLLLALGIFITYMATKSFFKKKMLSQLSDPSVYSKESSKVY